MTDRATVRFPVRLPDVLEGCGVPRGGGGVVRWSAETAPPARCLNEPVGDLGGSVSFGHAAARLQTAGPSAPAPCAIRHGPRLALRGSPRASPAAREGSGSGAILEPGCLFEGEWRYWGGGGCGRTLRPRACRRGPGDPTSGPRTQGRMGMARAVLHCTWRSGERRGQSADACPTSRGLRTRIARTGGQRCPARGASAPMPGVQRLREPGQGAPPLEAGCALRPTASRGCRAARAESAGSWIDCLP